MQGGFVICHIREMSWCNNTATYSIKLLDVESCLLKKKHIKYILKVPNKNRLYVSNKHIILNNSEYLLHIHILLHLLN